MAGRHLIDRRRVLCGGTALALTAGLSPARAARPPGIIAMGKGIDDMVSLDPAEIYELSGGEVAGNLYDRLVEVDPRAPGTVRPGLARSWRIEEEGRRFVLALRDDASFASGRAVTSEDAAFSLARALRLDKSPALVLRQLGLTADNVAERVRALDPLSLAIETPAPLAPGLVLACLTSVVASVVDRAAVLAHEVGGDLGNGFLAVTSAGSGPYRLRRWRPAERYVLDANPEYWGGAPANRTIIVANLREAATQQLMLLGGDLDYARDLDKDQLASLSRDPRFRLDRGVQSLQTYLALNQRHPHLRRPDVIEAMKYLVDYQGIVASVLGGTALIRQSFEPRGLLGAIDDAAFRFDPERARALLARAGLEGGFSVTIDVRNAWPSTDIAEALQASFAEAAIRLEIIPGDGKQVLTKYRARHHDIFLGEWGPDYLDPHSNAEAFAFNDDNSDDAPKKTPAWRNSWSDPEMNARVLAARSELDPDRRALLYGELQRLHQRRAPFIFLFETVATAARRATVDGFLIGFGPAENRYAGIARVS